ncbi:MAG: L-lysine 6-transaminase [Candidatus Marinimicrobia bacterium]|nr:L-lysine 6-transaminase [Candidatus Neomarinimicrobiota bacterium]
MSIAPTDVHKTIAKHMLADGMEQVIDLKKSHGSWLVDARNGREYLDLFSMFASMPIGYNHPYMMENKDRLTHAALNKVTNSDVYSTEMAEFVETVARIAQPDYLPYAFYVEGGTLAVENALKVSFDWKVRKNLAAGKGAKGGKVLHFKDCFHGRSGYTMSLTDSPDPRKTLYFPKFDWPRVLNPKITFPLDEAAVAEAEIQSITEIEAAINANPDDIAALIIEPIQGEGGDNHFREEFFRELKTICDENEILFIYDEIQTGIGLTGKMWAHQHYSEDCRPDIISFGKKTQICGIFVSDRVDDVENNVFHESSRLNSTFGGNIADMVRFTLYLEVIEKEGLVQIAAENGEYVLDKLQALQKKYGDVVSNSRGKGHFCAFDLPNGDILANLLSLIADEGALMLGCGTHSIRFRPHLNISQDEIDTGFEMIERAIQKL